ncbi:MAG: hypothetical protein ABI451_11440 [Dokdonella sp.]
MRRGSRLSHEVDEVLKFADSSRPWQFSLRWEKPERDRRVLLLGLLLALLMTVIELVGFGLGMRHRPRQIHPDSPIQVSVIDVAENLPLPAEPEPPAFVQRPSKVFVEPPKIRIRPPPLPPAEASDAISARIGAAAPARLFNQDGSIALPSAPTSVPAKPSNQQEVGRARWADLQHRGENPLDCKRTRFAKDYKIDQSLGDEVAGKYLKWIGLADGEAIAHRQQQRAQRAAEGCDPP